MKYLNLNDYIYKYDMQLLKSSFGFFYYKTWSITRNRMIIDKNDRLHVINLFDRYFQNRMISVNEWVKK